MLFSIGIATAVANECTLEFSQPTGIAQRYTAEIARTPGERARGLMARTELAPGHGMLFDFRRELRVAMWMKDTLLPLDMVFITASGRVRRIERGAVPLSETTIFSGGVVRYVLEVGAGDATPIIPGRGGSRLNITLLQRCLELASTDY